MSITYTRVGLALLLATATASCGGQSKSEPPLSSAITKSASGVAVTLKSVETGQTVGAMGLVPAAPQGATYVHVTYALKNTGKAPLPFEGWPQPRLLDANGNRLEPEVFASTALSAAANTGWAETINPNLSTEAQLVWKVDEKSFDRSKWKVAFGTAPGLEFPLK